MAASGLSKSDHSQESEPVLDFLALRKRALTLPDRAAWPSKSPILEIFLLVAESFPRGPSFFGSSRARSGAIANIRYLRSVTWTHRMESSSIMTGRSGAVATLAELSYLLNAAIYVERGKNSPAPFGTQGLLHDPFQRLVLIAQIVGPNVGMNERSNRTDDQCCQSCATMTACAPPSDDDFSQSRCAS